MKTCEPSSNLRLDSPLSHELLFVTVMLPGFELKVIPCFLLPKAIERLIVWLTGMSSPPSLKPLPSLSAVVVPSLKWPLF